MAMPAQCWDYLESLKKISEAALRSFLGSFGFSGERMDTPSKGFQAVKRAPLALGFDCLATPPMF